MMKVIRTAKSSLKSLSLGEPCSSTGDQMVDLGRKVSFEGKEINEFGLERPASPEWIVFEALHSATR